MLHVGRVPCSRLPTTGVPLTMGVFRARSTVAPDTPPDEAGASFSVTVLSAGASSGSRRLVTVAVATCSPVCPTVPQMWTCVLVPGEMNATSQERLGGLPVQPGPRSAYVLLTVYPAGRLRSRRTSEDPPDFEETATL